MNIFTKDFVRKARRNWCCDKCHQMIMANTTYLDQEIYYVTQTFCGTNTSVKHKRLCAACSGYLKEPKQYVFKEPEPVMDLTDNMKYWLVGVGYKPGTKDLYLIAKDWQGSKYHWKTLLQTSDGDLLNTSNVRFV